MKKKLINIVIVLGVLLRLVYACYTDYNERQHDIEPEVGHIAYIEHIYNNWTLPEHNKWQFYHPPLHHIISAVWMKAVSFSFFDDVGLLQSLKVLPFIYSVLILLISKKIMEEINLKDKYILLVMLIMAFHPSFIFTSAWINNDPLTYMLTFAIILFLFKWIKNIDKFFEETENNADRKIVLKNTIILAILMGCCVMTKLNGALIAIPVAIMFIAIFVKYIKNRNIKKYVVLLAIFGIISLTLGLWYPIRNYIKFGQELTYVPTPGDLIYTGKYSIGERLFSISKTELFDEVFCDVLKDHNIISFVIKSSLFGEYNYFNPFIAQMLKLINIILIIIVIIALIRCMIIKGSKELNIFKLILILIHLVNIFSFIWFNIQKPYACTMDFRYIAITVFTGALLIAIDLQDSEGKKYHEIYQTIVYISVVIFSILSGIMFLIK